MEIKWDSACWARASMGLPNGDNPIVFFFIDSIHVQIWFLQAKRLCLQVKGTRCDIMRASFSFPWALCPGPEVLHQDNFIHCLFSFQLSQSRQAAITTNQRLGALKSSDFFLIVLWLEVHDQDARASSVRVATVCLHMALPLHMVLPLYLCIVGRREVCVGKRKRGRLSTLMSFYVNI